MIKIIKYTKCTHCGIRIDIGESAVKFDDDIFCDYKCLHNYVEWETDGIDLDEDDCDFEEEDCDDEDE